MKVSNSITKRFAPLLVCASLTAPIIFGACQRRSAETIFPEYVAKKREAEQARLAAETAENQKAADKPAPQFFRESDSR